MKPHTFKKIVSLFLLACLCFPFIGIYAWLNFQKRGLKKEVKKNIIAQMNKNDLCYLSFSLKETEELLDWEHDKEFEYKGKMYDVIEEAFTADSVHYWCWLDKEETELNNRLAQALNLCLGESKERKEQNNRLREFCKVLYLNIDVYDRTYYLTDGILNREEYQKYLSIYYFPPTPPPEFI